MKVIFLESVEGTARAGEVKDVKNGFARNYLLPRGLAAPAVKPYLQRAQGAAKREVKLEEELDAQAQTIAERLEGTRIAITARVGEQGKLYGSVTSVHIAREVAQLIGQEEFDHRKVLMPEAIKEVGVQPVRLRLTRNIEAAVEVEVIAEGEEPSTAEAPEAETPVEHEPAAEAEAEESSEAAEEGESEETEPAEGS